MLPQISKLIILSHLCLFNTFQIISHTQNKQSLESEQTLKLVCKSDSSWEFCLWTHTNSEYEELEVRDCLMEWKRAKGGVSVQKCHEELTERISISGDYDSHECGLTITGLQLGDGGHWECEMEEYTFGNWASGDKHTHSFDVDVNLRTTTTTTTSTTTTSTTTTTTTSTSSSTEINTHSEHEELTELPITKIDPENISFNDDDIDSDKNDDESVEHDSYPEYEEDNEVFVSNKTVGRSDIPVYDEDVEALAIEDEVSAEVSVGLVAVIVVVIIGLAVGAVGGGFFWNRKRKSIGVVALHKIKDYTGASNSCLEESEYHVSIVGEPEE